MARAALIDLYRTLVEPDWPRLLAGRDVLADRAGVRRDRARDAWIATHEARMRGENGSLERDLAAVFEAARTDGDSALDERLVAQLAAEERASWRAGVRPYRDSIPALGRLRRAGLRVAIVTNSSAEAASVIPELGLDALVDLVVASCEAGVLKPELLELARDRLGVPPGDTVVVDDDPEVVAAAEGLGMAAILVRRDGAAEAGALRRRAVSSLAEATDLLLGGGRRPPR